MSADAESEPEVKFDDGNLGGESFENGEEKFRKPLIIGSVEGREAYLLFKLRPVTDGMVKVKYEDGFIEEVLAEKFRINRIAEE